MMSTMNKHQMILIIDVIQCVCQKCNSGDQAVDTTDQTKNLEGRKKECREIRKEVFYKSPDQSIDREDREFKIYQRGKCYWTFMGQLNVELENSRAGKKQLDIHPLSYIILFSHLLSGVFKDYVISEKPCSYASKEKSTNSTTCIRNQATAFLLMAKDGTWSQVREKKEKKKNEGRFCLLFKKCVIIG